ncbi:PDI family protein, putative [Babesia ovata]|uniref:protein-disulfide reductase n=1 Tax=Babesia ovata TaxID=189622 RepID=A0A2H6KAN6_9APIC|nr:PDI family protein, putative [Babesia ovata]GBE60045.1 PDI family protein, putative [Babesia ovata]
MATDSESGTFLGRGNLKNQRGDTVSAQELYGKSVGLLFCDGSSPRCCSIIPFLIQFYNSVNGQGTMPKIEIVYVSCDATRETFDNNVRRMPWLHLDFNDPLLPVLRHRYNVIECDADYGSFNSVEIPSIIVVNSHGSEIQRFALYHGREQSAQALRRWDWRNCLFA